MNRLLLDFSDIDIRDEDLSLIIDVVKNEQNKEALEKEDPDSPARLDSWFRIWTMLLKIRLSLQEFKKKNN